MRSTWGEMSLLISLWLGSPFLMPIINSDLEQDVFEENIPSILMCSLFPCIVVMIKVTSMIISTSLWMVTVGNVYCVLCWARHTGICSLNSHSILTGLALTIACIIIIKNIKCEYLPSTYHWSELEQTVSGWTNSLPCTWAWTFWWRQLWVPEVLGMSSKNIFSFNWVRVGVGWG